jgi:hypothetical protein
MQREWGKKGASARGADRCMEINEKMCMRGNAVRGATGEVGEIVSKRGES